MFYEPKTLIVVYKDEILANQIKKLIETKDDKEGAVTGTRDNSINVVTWTEKVWLANKKAGNITSKVLFLGDIKGVDSLIPVLDLKFEKHGVRYGWAGNQAVVYARPNEIKTIENYYAFHKELKVLPIPQSVKDAVKPNNYPANAASAAPIEVSVESEENKGFIAKGQAFFKKLDDSVVEFVGNTFEKVSVFSEETFRNKKAMERQMLFFGIINLYNDNLEMFMNA